MLLAVFRVRGPINTSNDAWGRRWSHWHTRKWSAGWAAYSDNCKRAQSDRGICESRDNLATEHTLQCHFNHRICTTIIYRKPVSYTLRPVWDTGTWYPRPRQVCQVPGLGQFGLKADVPGKLTEALATISWYSAQILICFVAYIFHVPIPMWVGLGTLGFWTSCELWPLPIVIRMRQSLKSIKSSITPCMNWWNAAGWDTLWHLCHRSDEPDR